MWTVGKLTDVQVRAAGAGTHGDGGGLYLAVKRGTAGLTRSWLFRYSIGGRSHWTGLGAYPDISLQRARQKAQECRQQLYNGIDPLQCKRDQQAALRQQHANGAPTFAECAAQDQYHARQITHAPEPAMRSPNAEREFVSSASDAERPLPYARRKIPRRSKGE